MQIRPAALLTAFLSCTFCVLRSAFRWESAGIGLSSVLVAITAVAADPRGWPTAGHDVRRTGQSTARGPRTPAHVGTFMADDGQSINMPATIAPDGTVFLGTWGMIRSYGTTDRTQWHKSDGRLYAITPTLKPRWPQPYPGVRVPYCYSYPGREPTPGQCPDGGTVMWYNGTVEGTPSLSHDGSVVYFGRGDGKLYAIDVRTGQAVWVFTTFNPEAPSDPDGGGEIIAGTLVASNGIIYAATAGAGPHETNAVYAVAPDGTMLWRYPHAKASLPNIIAAEPALSPDGRTLYVAGAWGPSVGEWDTTVPGSIYAFDVSAPSGTGDERLKWVVSPVNQGEWWKPTVWTTSLAVGSNGILYAAGPEYTASGGTAVAFALIDHGTSATLAWPSMVRLDFGRAALSLGVALRETNGNTTRVFVSSGNGYSGLVQGYGPGGKLHALDPGTGAALWPAPFDPEAHGATGSMTGIAIDADGVIYTGVSGQRDKGMVFAINPDGSLRWKFTLGGLLEWAHPVLGPDGSLWVAESRRCFLAFLPLESGACASVNIDPAIYVIRDQPARRRGVHR